MRMFSTTELGVIKSGVLDLVSFDSKFSSIKSNTKANHQKVVVVVYKTSLEHFAVVYPHWGLISAKRPFCMINLKRARVERSVKDPGHQFTILAYRNSDLSMVLCFTQNTNDCKSDGFEAIESWINALQTEDTDNENSVRNQWKWSSKRRVSKSTLLSVLNEDDSEEYGI